MFCWFWWVFFLPVSAEDGLGVGILSFSCKGPCDFLARGSLQECSGKHQEQKGQCGALKGLLMKQCTEVLDGSELLMIIWAVSQ